MPSRDRLDIGRVTPGRADWFEIGGRGSAQETIAVHVVRGTKSGPCCALIAGVHGDEYDGIVAATEFIREIDKSSLSGSAVVIPVANPLAFAAGVRMTPADGKDLNRVFPGKREGTVTERIADLLCDGILAGADLVFSLHGSAATGVLVPWIEFLDVPGDLGRKTFLAASDSNFPDLIALPYLPGVLQTALAERNIPTIEGEVGGGGATARANVDYYKDRIVDVLTHLGMLPASKKPTGPKRIWRLHSIDAQKTGILITMSALEADIIEGQTLGIILDGRGNIVSEIRSPAKGRIGGLRQHAGVRIGDRVASLWLPVEPAETEPVAMGQPA
jgi:predicted deacylase